MTSCSEAQGNYGIDPHFDPNCYPATTFVDTGFPGLANQCGDLVFNNRVSVDAWAAQRDPGIHLRGAPGDVQLVLSAGETTGESTWTFVVIRGDGPAAVRGTADAVLRPVR